MTVRDKELHTWVLHVMVDYRLSIFMAKCVVLHAVNNVSGSEAKVRLHIARSGHPLTIVAISIIHGGLNHFHPVM